MPHSCDSQESGETSSLLTFLPSNSKGAGLRLRGLVAAIPAVTQQEANGKLSSMGIRLRLDQESGAAWSQPAHHRSACSRLTNPSQA